MLFLWTIILINFKISRAVGPVTWKRWSRSAFPPSTTARRSSSSTRTILATSSCGSNMLVCVYFIVYLYLRYLKVWLKYVIRARISKMEHFSSRHIYSRITEDIYLSINMFLVEILKRWICNLVLQTNLYHNPMELFQTLESKNMFTELSAFYENWAISMEETGNMKKTDQIYQQGILNAKDSKTPLQEAHRYVCWIIFFTLNLWKHKIWSIPESVTGLLVFIWWL